MVKSVRKRPVNLTSFEEYIFSHELEKVFSGEEMLTVRNVFFDSELRIINKRFPDKILRSLPQFQPTILQYIRFFLLGRFSYLSSKKIIVTDGSSYGYFHWLHDCLPRLLLVYSDVASAQIVLPHGLKKFPYVTESLGMLGITNYRYLRPGVLYLIRNLLFPVHLAPSGNYNDEMMKKLRQLFHQDIKDAPSAKVYISRSKSQRRKVANEHELSAILEEAGFETIYCEDLSFARQVQLFSRIKYLVANHGAGLSNILFMQGGTKLLELRAENDSHNNCYFSLASALDLRYYYQLCPKTNPSEDAHTADILVNASQLLNNIKLMLKDA